MATTDVARLVVFTFTAGFGWAVIGYAGYANQHGWPIGALFARDFSWLQGLAYIALVGAVAASVFVGAWWHVLVVLVGANVLVRALFPVAGPRSQVASGLGILVGIPLSVAMVWL